MVVSGAAAVLLVAAAVAQSCPAAGAARSDVGGEHGKVVVIKGSGDGSNEGESFSTHPISIGTRAL